MSHNQGISVVTLNPALTLQINKRTKSIPDEVELTRMMNDTGAVTPDATIHGTESAAVQAIRKALYGDSPSYPDTNADPSPDSDYGSEIDAPTECDLKPYDDNMFCSIELMDNDLWDQAEEDKYRGDALTSREGESFDRLIRRFNPPILYEHAGIYREWLLHSSLRHPHSLRVCSL